MAQRYHSRRSVKRLARKSKRRFFITLAIIAVISYATISWILPNFILGLGFVKNTFRPPDKNSISQKESAIAPPVLNIPFEATNSAQIDIHGYGTPDSKVKLYIDDTAKETTEVSPDGKFTFSNISLVLGTNNIYAKTINEKNSESLPSKTLRVNYDRDKPILEIKEPENGRKIQGGDKKVRVSGTTEAGAKVYINDAQTIVDKDGNFSSEIPLNDGDNTIPIKAKDDAGNETKQELSVNYSP